MIGSRGKGGCTEIGPEVRTLFPDFLSIGDSREAAPLANLGVDRDPPMGNDGFPWLVLPVHKS